MEYGQNHKYQGLWENDNIQGYGIHYYPDSTYYKGTFKNGKRNG